MYLFLCKSNMKSWPSWSAAQNLSPQGLKAALMNLLSAEVAEVEYTVNVILCYDMSVSQKNIYFIHLKLYTVKCILYIIIVYYNSIHCYTV